MQQTDNNNKTLKITFKAPFIKSSLSIFCILSSLDRHTITKIKTQENCEEAKQGSTCWIDKVLCLNYVYMYRPVALLACSAIDKPSRSSRL